MLIDSGMFSIRLVIAILRERQSSGRRVPCQHKDLSDSARKAKFRQGRTMSTQRLTLHRHIAAAPPSSYRSSGGSVVAAEAGTDCAVEKTSRISFFWGGGYDSDKLVQNYVPTYPHKTFTSF